MDCVNSVFIILPVEGEIKKYTSVIYEFYFRNKDDAVPACFSF